MMHRFQLDWLKEIKHFIGYKGAETEFEDCHEINYYVALDTITMDETQLKEFGDNLSGLTAHRPFQKAGASRELFQNKEKSPEDEKKGNESPKKTKSEPPKSST